MGNDLYWKQTPKEPDLFEDMEALISGIGKFNCITLFVRG